MQDGKNIGGVESGGGRGNGLRVKDGKDQEKHTLSPTNKKKKTNQNDTGRSRVHLLKKIIKKHTN